MLRKEKLSLVYAEYLAIGGGNEGKISGFHEYLQRKKILFTGTKHLINRQNLLFIPIFDSLTDSFITAQYISPAGKTRFAKCLSTAGGYARVARKAGTSDFCFFVESYADALTAVALTDATAYCCFYRDNVAPVIRNLLLRKKVDVKKSVVISYKSTGGLNDLYLRDRGRAKEFLESVIK